MAQHLDIIFSSVSFYHLCGLVAAGMFFLMAGVRELKSQRLEGLLYLTLGLFFIVAHIVYFASLPVDSPVSFLTCQLDFWNWIIHVLAPVLIALYLLLGLYDFFKAELRAALVKAFFGLTLLCFLYMLGPDWPVDVKGILALVWSLVWFNVELESAV